MLDCSSAAHLEDHNKADRVADDRDEVHGRPSADVAKLGNDCRDKGWSKASSTRGCERQQDRGSNAQGLETAPIRDVAMDRMPRPDECEAKDDVAQYE